MPLRDPASGQAIRRLVELGLKGEGEMRWLDELGRIFVRRWPMTTVWIYVDTKYHVGHPDHLKVFANPVAADEWFRENDPEGIAFEYEVLE